MNSSLCDSVVLPTKCTGGAQPQQKLFKSGTQFVKKTQRRKIVALNIGAFLSKKKKKENKPSAILQNVSNPAQRCSSSSNLQMSAGCEHNILPENQRVFTAPATAVVVARVIAFVSAVALKFRGIATCQEEMPL